jgi:hypothetical protein
MDISEVAGPDTSETDVERCDLQDRARQLAEWLESEFRLLTVDDVSEEERERMEERARTARELEALL